MRPYLAKRARAFSAEPVEDSSIIYDEVLHVNVLSVNGIKRTLMEISSEASRTKTLTEIRTESPDRDFHDDQDLIFQSLAGTKTSTLIRNERSDKDPEQISVHNGGDLDNNLENLNLRLALASTITQTKLKNESPDRD